MSHAHESHAPAYPLAPRTLDPEAARSWGDLIRMLSERDMKTLIGTTGNGEFRVTEAVPVSVTLDLSAIEVTATAQALAKLINDLADGGILKLTHI